MDGKYIIHRWCETQERVPKPTRPIRLTDISPVQHDDVYGMDGKYIGWAVLKVGNIKN